MYNFAFGLMTSNLDLNLFSNLWLFCAEISVCNTYKRSIWFGSARLRLVLFDLTISHLFKLNYVLVAHKNDGVRHGFGVFDLLVWFYWNGKKCSLNTGHTQTMIKLNINDTVSMCLARWSWKTHFDQFWSPICNHTSQNQEQSIKLFIRQLFVLAFQLNPSSTRSVAVRLIYLLKRR